MSGLAPALFLLSLSAVTPPEVNGYVDSRTQWTDSRLSGLLPTNDLARFDELFEANVQVRQHYSEKGQVYGDVSLFGRFAGNYRALDANGNEVVVPDHHVPGNDPLVSLSELYVSHDLGDSLNILVGRKRLVWGPGFSFNPTDILNPPKDPTDPSFQRAGAYLARVEYTTANFTFTLLGAPAVTEAANGIPYRFLTYPSWDKRDDETHYLLAARLYALIANSDVNLMLFYGNKFTEAEPFHDRLRGGVSFSRYFFTDYEFHLEALLQTGTARQYAEGACVTDSAALLQCLAQKTPLQSRTRINDTTFTPRVLAGVRRQFDDESMLSLEYLYQADGYTREEFESFVRVAALSARLAQLSAASPSRAIDTGVPQKFAFQPLVKHYAFITWQKPRIHDDWTVGGTVITNLQDLSGMVTPTVSWQAEEWLTFSLLGFIPFPGPDELSAKTPAVNLPQFGLTTGEHLVTEYGLLPFDYRVLFEVRAYY